MEIYGGSLKNGLMIIMESNGGGGCQRKVKVAKRRRTGPLRSRGGTTTTSGTIHNYFCKVRSLKDEWNLNGKRRLDEDEDMDDDMTEDDGDGNGDGNGTADVIRMELDLTMETDQKTTKGGPNSGQRKKMVMAEKKMKMGLIINYFHSGGKGTPEGVKHIRKTT